MHVLTESIVAHDVRLNGPRHDPMVAADAPAADVTDGGDADRAASRTSRRGATLRTSSRRSAASATGSASGLLPTGSANVAPAAPSAKGSEGEDAEGGDAEAQAKLHKSGTVKVAEVTKVAGARWKALGSEEKAPFETMAAEDKAKKLAEFESTTAVEGGSEESATVTAATPPAAPATADIMAAAAILMKAKQAKEAESDEQLLASLQEQGDAMDEDEEEGPWNYTTPAGVDAAVDRWGDDYVVVPFAWYDENDEATEAEWRENVVGYLTNVTLPEEEDDPIQGDFKAHQA